MDATARKNEILKAMPSFSMEAYSKAELLPELFKLQSELVNLTFNDEHAEKAQLKIWDVQTHLANLNADRDHVADELLKNFSDGCKLVNESIRGEISGNRGENRALWSIETVHTKHTVLRNIELSSGFHKSELDIIVFTEKAIFVVEVKNPMRDITIDEKGNYRRISNGKPFFDKNIGEKMNDKTFLLRSVLQKAGIADPNIISMVVFTNNNITVTNNYPFIKHCFLSSLPCLIDTYEGEVLYTDETIAHMVRSVEATKQVGSYAPPLDINQFKQDFADLMVTLENIPEENPEDIPGPVQNEAEECITKPFWRKCADFSLEALPVVGLTALAIFGFNKLRRT